MIDPLLAVSGVFCARTPPNPTILRNRPIFPCRENASSVRPDFGVSAWGVDFSPRAHGRIVQKAADEGYLPRVDVFLPVCGEPTALLANSWSSVRELDYPATHLAVYVLDDGGAEEKVKSLVARLGFRCELSQTFRCA